MAVSCREWWKRDKALYQSVVNLYVCVHLLYLAGAYSTAVKARFPVFPVASDSLFLWAVAAAAGTRRAHTVVASREVHTHAVIPAGVCLQTALVDVWKRKKRVSHDK